MKKQKLSSIAKIHMGGVIIGAVATDDYDYQHLYDRHRTMDKAVSYMGFDDANSYMDQYPGTFLKESNIVKFWMCTTTAQSYHSQREIFLNLYCAIIHVTTTRQTMAETSVKIDDFADQVKRLLSWGMLGNGSFMLPLTTDEAKHSLGFTEVPKSEMWYCIDWKG